MADVEITVPPIPAITIEVANSLVELAIDPIVVQGPPGTWGIDKAFQLRQLSLPILSGVVTIDFEEANTYFLLLTANVTSILFTNIPAAGISGRIQLDIRQDEVGGWTLEGWPANVRTSGGVPPVLSDAPEAYDCLVLDTFDGGQVVKLNQVGFDYLPISG